MSEMNELVWRKIWRRFWFYDSTKHRTTKIWRRVRDRVPANYSPPQLNLEPSTDPRLISYADCEAFFEAVIKGSRKELRKILNTHGPDVITELSNSYNEHGETPLLVAIKLGKVDMVKFLVGKLGVPIGQIGRFLCRRNKYVDVPALFAAIFCGELGIAAYLLSKEVESQQTANIIDSIISSSNSRSDKIDILELLGAVNLYFFATHPARQNGFSYWREAMGLRNSTIDGEPIQKYPFDFQYPTQFCAQTFPDDIEFTTAEQLHHLSEHFEQEGNFDPIIQGLLVSERILSKIVNSPGPHIFTLTYLCQYASLFHMSVERLGDLRSIPEVTNILRFVLEESKKLEWKDEYEKSKINNWAINIMKSFMSRLGRKQTTSPVEEPWISKYLMTFFEFATGYMSDLLEDPQQTVDKETLLHLIDCIMATIFSLNEMPQLDPNEREMFERSLSKFIRNDHRGGTANQNILHRICCLSSAFKPFISLSNDQLNGLINYSFSFQRDDLINSEGDNDTDGDIGVLDMNFNGFLDDSSTINDSESNEYIDSDNYSVRSDHCHVIGCSSCGHGMETSSDDSSDDAEFQLMHGDYELTDDSSDDDEEAEIQNHPDEEPEIQNNPQEVIQHLSEENLISVTQLILRLGADPNATDLYGTTPLQLLAMANSSIGQCQMLLKYGAHFDQADRTGTTPMKHFQEWQKQLVNEGNPDPNLQSLMNSVLPLRLSCLAAQIIRKNQIPLDEEKIPCRVHSFIQRH